MNPDTFYRDHWLDIDPEQIEAYEEMFRWHPRMETGPEPAVSGSASPGPSPKTPG